MSQRGLRCRRKEKRKSIRSKGLEGRGKNVVKTKTKKMRRRRKVQEA